MPSLRPPQGLEDVDYETIEAAVMETARGRWFLLEHARRTREAETSRMIDALGQIESMIRQQAAAQEALPDQNRIAEISRVFEERLLDLSWSLRAKGVDPSICDMIDREVSGPGFQAAAPQTLDPPQIPSWPTATEEIAPRLQPDLSAHSENPIVTAAAMAAVAPEIVVPEPEPIAVPIRREALVWLDDMPARERMRIFA